MNRITLLLMMLVFTGVSALAGTTFDFVIATTNANQTYCFLVADAQNFVIDWGDGNTNTLLSVPGTSEQSHSYAVAGLYTNRVSGEATRFSFGSAVVSTGTTPELLKDIISCLSDGVTGIKSAERMFNKATSITQFTQVDWFDAVSTNVTTMAGMFSGASSFNQDISGWSVSNVTNMAEMFNSASKFNQPIGGWDVRKVTNMRWMFCNAFAFNQDLSDWNVGKLTDMSYLFRGTSVFDQDIGRWGVSNVTAMKHVFYGAAKFNQDIGNWNVSKVTDMEWMFHSAPKFNQDIGRWNVSKVTNMDSMFLSAVAFNQDIGGWNVSNVTTMWRMFYGASAFKQDISHWNVSKVANLTNFLYGASLPTNFYNQVLIRWSRLPLKPGLGFHGGTSKYDNGLPLECRKRLTDPVALGGFNWVITDGGPTGKPYQSPPTVFNIR